jgi:hypothetical protein
MIATRLVPLFVVVSVACSGLPTVASAASAKPSAAHAKHHKKPSKKAAKKKTSKKASGALRGVVPAVQLAAFRALKAPPVRELPTTISRRLRTDPHYAELGIDGSQARRVGEAAAPFYLIPGKDGICIVLPDGGSACVNADSLSQAGLAQVAATGLSVDLVDAATNPDGSISPAGGPATSFGVVPNGFTQVTATTLAGRTFSTNITNNSYVLKADGPIVSRTYTGPAVAPVALPL